MLPIVLIPANESLLRRLLSPVAPLDKFWMTYRLPWQKHVTITYPPKLSRETAEASPTLSHEKMHADDLSGPWYRVVAFLLLATLLPLPVLFSGRWLIERHAYLEDIKRGRRSVDDAVSTLWKSYGWCWPPILMRRWFLARL